MVFPRFSRVAYPSLHSILFWFNDSEKKVQHQRRWPPTLGRPACRLSFVPTGIGRSSRSQMTSLFGSKTHYWGILFPIATGNWSDWTGKEGDEQLTLY